MNLTPIIPALLLAGCAAVEPTPAPQAEATRYEIVGYYPGWKGPIEVDASLLTVVNYAFLVVGADGALMLDKPAVDESHFAYLAALKAKNPQLKLMGSVGGWTRSDRFSDMAASVAGRANFIGTSIAFLRGYGFDGIDIDWEYPGAIGVPCTPDRTCERPEDKRNFVTLVRELRAALNAAAVTDKKRYFITIAAGADRKFLFDGASAQWMVQLAGVLDWVNLMTYDYHGTWETASGMLAPLMRDPADPSETNVDASVTMFLAAGVPAKKLTLGVPFYAKAWKGCTPGPKGDGLYQPCEASIPDEALDPVIRGERHRGPARAPYAYDVATKTFTTFDDEASIREKIEYLRSRGLLGAMYWEIAADRDRSLATAISSGLPH